MSDNVCEVTINGSASGTYYTNCENIKYLGDNLENTSNSTIYLYRFKNHSNNSYNPQIRISPFRLPIYYGTQNASGVELTNVTKVTYNDIGNFYHFHNYFDASLYFILAVICVITLIKGK